MAHPIIFSSKKDAFFSLVVTGLLILLIFILCLLAPAAHAGEVTVAWDPNPEPDVAGYKIYYGTSPGSYSSFVNAGNITSIVISGLAAGATYYFAAVAYDGSGNESGFSNEIAYAVPGAATADSSSSGGGGACFIATAAFGNYRAPEVILLRQFRDRFLLTNAPGRLFVDVYYRLSPSLADFISQYDSLRSATRLALKPLIFTIQHRLGVYAGVLILMLAITAILYAEQRRIWWQVQQIRG
ncbi:MAG TPA: fibronectin type III domain-containing protein [Syntrophales bacterium]|nr:fibronectin type III domain-containing protein [Syntrophales bacterium]